MKLFQATHQFDHPWDTLTRANWRKYPNELSDHVLSVDILSRSVDPQTGVLRTERLLCCKQNAPSLLRRLMPSIPEYAYFREVSELNPNTREYTAQSVNLTLRNLLTVTETCVYRADPTDATKTIFEQRASVVAGVASSAFKAVAGMMEDVCVSSFKTNAEKGRRALEMVVDKVIAEARGLEGFISDGFEELRTGFAGPAAAAAAP
ncbi:PRELI-like family-domain-containing protein [Cladochytrium replicatum]|nr:PRELI-like family-domain-containing protein [Cladochytrium replicatum]